MFLAIFVFLAQRVEKDIIQNEIKKFPWADFGRFCIYYSVYLGQQVVKKSA